MTKLMVLGTWIIVLFTEASSFARAGGEIVAVSADPPQVHLSGRGAFYTLLLQGKTSDGRQIDLTRSARYRCRDSRIAVVDERGCILAAGDGSTTVTAEVAGRKVIVPVSVSDTLRQSKPHFVRDVVPLLSKFGCNSSGCHGKAEGQNGFKLSVFGFNPAADYEALTRESRGRRLFPAAPEQSLFLRKASGSIPHGGGVRIQRESREYQTLLSWVAAGAPWGDPGVPGVVCIRVEPESRIMAMRDHQQLRVIATYADRRECDVSLLAKYQTNNDGLAAVDGSGLVTAGKSPGDVAIMASFMDAVAIFRALIPRPETISTYPELPENNFIDQLVFGKLRRLYLIPSGLCDDATYLRRVYLDLIGTLPTLEEARQFLNDVRVDRRQRLVDELLRRPEFADFWAIQWADLLRVDRQELGHKNAYVEYRWLRDSFAVNKPLDQMARELICAEGPLGEVGPANFYRVVPRPGDAASTLAQVFLGIRLACAQCHHHPFDRWSQNDYYRMAAFFAPLTLTNDILSTGGEAAAIVPRTGMKVFPHPLGDQALTLVSQAGNDRREELARWLTAPENPWFSRNLANRTWAHFLGRGLIEPVDDVRATNPPTNPELLSRLACYLSDHHYDFRQLLKLITASRVYQLSAHPSNGNECDEQNYSRALFRRIPAEVLLDMIGQATGVNERYAGALPGTRAIQLWDNKTPDDFLRLFGRPNRVSACECERMREPTVSQVLHLLNAPEIQGRLGQETGRLARLVRAQPDDHLLVEQLYLTFYSRIPSQQERTTALAYLRRQPEQRRQAAEDLAWSMLNSLEFLFNH